ncbi:MAG: hypothetical protein NWS55_04150 [Solirubrobacteraceae bacterium]|jgi:hypothetical protein|nr:hypothetical protein [Solirubrobacteraceae bacterium]MDP4672797.1 hypothetical protein [Solirubrobacteraceae bacterium]
MTREGKPRLKAGELVSADLSALVDQARVAAIDLVTRAGMRDESVYAGPGRAGPFT